MHIYFVEIHIHDKSWFDGKKNGLFHY